MAALLSSMWHHSPRERPCAKEAADKVQDMLIATVENRQFARPHHMLAPLLSAIAHKVTGLSLNVVLLLPLSHALLLMRAATNRLRGSHGRRGFRSRRLENRGRRTMQKPAPDLPKATPLILLVLDLARAACSETCLWSDN
jgi:hypothetical protein